MARENSRSSRSSGFRLPSIASFQVPAVVQARFPHGIANVTQGFLPNLTLNQAPPVPLAETMRHHSVGHYPADGSIIIDIDPNMHHELALLQHSPPGADMNQNGPEAEDHGHSHTHIAGERPQDMRLFLEWMQKSGIFFILLFIKLMYDHRLGIIVFIALAGTFFYVNMTLVNYIHQNAVRESDRWCNIGIPLWLTVFLTINISLLYYMFAEQELWNGLILRMPKVGDVDIWTLLWIIALNDYIVKFGTVVIKSLISMLPYCCLPHQRRGKYYMFFETMSQCYRSFLTIVPWFHFLSSNHQTSRYFAWLTTAVYLVFKILGLTAALKGLLMAFQRLRVHSVYGTKPSRDDLKQRGDQCPICQDHFSEPVMLHCRHIFCEKCVSVWFDREKTCPMCRAQITENPQWQDGSTTALLQWY